MGAKVVYQFNMWVGVYNILFEWNGDFINVVNVVMDQCITCEVSLNVKYSCWWMYLWWIDKFDKTLKSGCFNLNSFWRSSKWNKRRMVHLIVSYRWNIELRTQYKIDGWRICWNSIWIVHRSQHIRTMCLYMTICDPSS